jgi:hypothetical protein
MKLERKLFPPRIPREQKQTLLANVDYLTRQLDENLENGISQTMRSRILSLKDRIRHSGKAHNDGINIDMLERGVGLINQNVCQLMFNPEKEKLNLLPLKDFSRS